MDLYVRFLFDFMSQFFGGVGQILNGIFNGLKQILNFKDYYSIIGRYSSDIKGGQWIFIVIAIILIIVLVGSAILLFVLLFKKYVRIRKSLVEQESLLDELGKLNDDVFKLTHEKEELFAMKVSQLGLKPGESSDDNVEFDEKGNPIIKDAATDEKKEVSAEGASRFFKLIQIDKDMETYVPIITNDDLSLIDICEKFRNFAAFKLGLYYKIDIIRLFLASFASNRLIILQGISGTGKTSLPYAWGKFIQNDAIIASVQPSWRDRTELFGFFNEFTKKFSETEVLKKMYEATYVDQVYITILDEMNIARVEYYFAEMLSILEMPSRAEWIIELVPSVWPTDPKRLPDGKLKLPDNMWYIGTINNDDSTFMVTDKVYDRAMPIDINDKGVKFDPPPTDPIRLSSKYLEKLFEEGHNKYHVSDENMDNLVKMDDYVIEHFRMAFGNRIVKQLKDFVPAYMACGGTEIDAIDYVIAHKILRKFEQLNLSFIRDEIDGFIVFLGKTFGKDNMGECKSFLLRLKKMM